MPANVEQIKKLVGLNKNLPIKIEQYAISDTTGKASFTIMPEHTMGKLSNSSFRKDDEGLKEVPVECITLDDLVTKGLPEPDFIKIDVEGAEEFVLKGAIGLLQRKRPFLMIEVHSPEIGERCLSILKPFYKNIHITETKQMPGMESGILNFSMKD